MSFDGPSAKIPAVWESPEPIEPKAGEVLGQYQLLAIIGEGGMGRVWAGRWLGSHGDRIVAVKCSRRDIGVDAEFAQVYMDEARIASSLHHPNVCGIYELGFERGYPYIVLEWCDGGTLHELLRAAEGRRIHPVLAARICSQACAGLHAAHELRGEDGQLLNLVHRDVSPQNLLISRTGQVKLTDFGIAKARGQLRQATDTGIVKGKPAYMAPEQLESSSFDRRADLFSVGCILYESTLGMRPFYGKDPAGVLYQVLQCSPKRPRAIDPDFPRELEDIIMGAITKHPEDRFQSAEEMQAALDGWLFQARASGSDNAVAEFVSTTLMEKIDAREALIQQSLYDLTEADTVITTSPFVSHQPPHRHSPVIESSEPYVIPTRSAHRSNVRQKARRATVAVSLGAAAAVGLSAAWAVRNRMQGAADATAVQAAAPPPVVRAPKSEPIVIELRAEPSHATLSIDGKEVANPHVLAVEPSVEPHIVQVRAEGFTTSTRTIRFTHNQSIEVVLAKTATETEEADSPRAGEPTRPRSTGRSAARTKPAATSTLSPASDTGDKPPPKPVFPDPRRRIDMDNPFE